MTIFVINVFNVINLLHFVCPHNVAIAQSGSSLNVFVNRNIYSKNPYFSTAFYFTNFFCDLGDVMKITSRRYSKSHAVLMNYFV